MSLLPDNAGISPRKRLIALSQSSPMGTRVFASGNSGWKTSELLGEFAQGFSWADSKIGGPDAS